MLKDRSSRRFKYEQVPQEIKGRNPYQALSSLLTHLRGTNGMKLTNLFER